MNYQDYMNKMQALAAKYDLTIDELQELLEMGYSEEDLAKMSVEKEDNNYSWCWYNRCKCGFVNFFFYTNKVSFKGNFCY